MEANKFKHVRMDDGNPKWEDAVKRLRLLPIRPDDIRTEFARDVTRLLHCTAYRRLKHKTQVFFAPDNDHICTRIEHVNHVVSISHTIAKFLGLNIEMTSAIALGHDIGHAPFGHAGEKIISEIMKKDLGTTFWHEKNSLRFVDKLETLENQEGNHINLNLTYAVRDGIICHCGEVDENSLFPRKEAIDLEIMKRPNEYAPFTWEGCVVKISDKIAYLGRDIEDALILRILTRSQLKELLQITKSVGGKKIREINNTIVIHNFIIDLCKHSSPDNGICISTNTLQAMNSINKFNYDNIYLHERLEPYKKYAELIINTIYEILANFYAKEKTSENLERNRRIYPLLIETFIEWLEKYAKPNKRGAPGNRYQNIVIYSLFQQNDYLQAIVDFISGMTDNFAKRVFSEIMSF